MNLDAFLVQALNGLSFGALLFLLARPPSRLMHRQPGTAPSTGRRVVGRHRSPLALFALLAVLGGALLGLV